jgi:peptidoglycan/LPS O-acetylase OafA/YrhL
MDISNFYIACLWSTLFFAMMMVPAHISFHYIEAPFMRLRKRYIVQNNDAAQRESVEADTSMRSAGATAFDGKD